MLVTLWVNNINNNLINYNPGSMMRKVGCDRRKDHRLRPSVGHGCDRRNDHRGIEDTELLDIRDVVRESWLKIKLLLVI